MRIRTKVLLTALALTVTPLAVVSTLAYGTAQQTITQQQIHQLESIASTQEARILDSVSSSVTAHALIAARSLLREAIADFRASGSIEDRDRIRVHLADAKSASPSISRVVSAGPDGTVLASTRTADEGQSVANDRAFLEGQARVRADLFLAGPDGQGQIVTTGPVSLGAPQLGTLIVWQQPLALNSIAQEFAGLDSTGETLLAQREPDGSIVYIAPLRFDATAALNRNVTHADSKLPIYQASLGSTDPLLDGVDYRGVPVVAVPRPVEGTSWVLAVKIDRAEAFLSLERFSGLLLGTTAVAVMMGGLVAVWLGHSLAGPITRLGRITDRVARGERDLDVPVETDDEIGELARDFSALLSSLLASQRELDQRVAKRTADLERSNKELEHFAYVASHDLQEPLRSVAGFTQLLKKRYEGKLDESADEYIQFTVEAVHRMQALIQDLLVYSRAGSQGKELGATPMDEVLGRVLSSLSAALEESGAQVVSADLPVVVGDEVQLGQLVQNLVGNAIKFRRPETPPVIRVSAEPMDGMWRITVADNGIGIEKEYFDRVFVKFQRLHARDKYEGTGIGLAVCKKIVDRHGGKIWVESGSGQGTRFHFTLRPAEPMPIDEEPAAAPRITTTRGSFISRGEELV